MWCRGGRHLVPGGISCRAAFGAGAGGISCRGGGMETIQGRPSWARHGTDESSRFDGAESLPHGANAQAGFLRQQGQGRVAPAGLFVVVPCQRHGHKASGGGKVGGVKIPLHLMAHGSKKGSLPWRVRPWAMTTRTRFRREQSEVIGYGAGVESAARCACHHTRLRMASQVHSAERAMSTARARRVGGATLGCCHLGMLKQYVLAAACHRSADCRTSGSRHL